MFEEIKKNMDLFRTNTNKEGVVKKMVINKKLVTLSLNADIYQQIDLFAKRFGMTRSGVVRMALMRFIEEQRIKVMGEKVAETTKN